MAFNENIDFWNNQTVADGQTMSAPLEKLLENDNFLKNELKVFFAEYEITTFEEVTNALAANKMVFLRKTITVSEENHVVYLPLSNKKASEPNVYTFSGISGHSGNLVISFTLSENDIWSFGNNSPFPSKQIQVVAYGSTSLTDLNSYFNKGLYLVCNRGSEYLPLISRSLINDSYEYIFSGSYEDKVVKLKCEVSGWTEETITIASGVNTTVSEITENTTVTLVAGQNRYLTCTNSPTISIEIADNNIYHLQINGSCTINLTGVSWSGDEITAITTNAEISILNGIAIGVLYE
jgi:hypothetical protein